MGGGLAQARLNRAEVRYQLSAYDRWAVDGLIEIYEAAALRAMAERRKDTANAAGTEGE